MSISVIGNTNLTAYTNGVASQQVYMSTTYALTNEIVFIKYKATQFGSNIPTTYITNFGENNSTIVSHPKDIISYSYSKPGSYYISYSAIYTDNSLISYILPQPFIIKDKWNEYNQEQLRLVNEITLKPPYTQDQIYIQPNEWGVEDIFNTSISRLQDNLDYLISNTQTINTQSPISYFGWLGSNTNSRASGIKWVTKTYNQTFVNNPELATSQGSSYFSNIKDATETADHILVLDGTKFRAFSSTDTPVERNFLNFSAISNLLTGPQSLDTNDSGDTVYIVDTPVNKIYKFYLNLSTSPTIDIQLSIGGFGNVNAHDKFNSPTEISFLNENVYVLDYNNYCVKEFNQDLNWIHTYTSSLLDNDQPVSVAVHPQHSFVYVLTQSHTLYIFDHLGSEPFATIILNETKDNYNLNKILFDDVGDFFYILTDQNIYKYSSSNIYISRFEIPKTIDVVYKSIRSTKDKSLIISSDRCLLKCQDFVETFKLGEGLPFNYWSRDQLKVSKDEFVTDFNYNRSLVRTVQNIKTFRNTLNAKFVYATEKNTGGIISYFSRMPINISERPQFENDIENETLGVGINELHVPVVFNKEFKKIYNALQILADFLSVKNVSIDDLNSINNSAFCWSWKAMSCYNLDLPLIKTSNTNPITYAELKDNFPIDYAPSKTWEDAKSNCCDQTITIPTNIPVDNIILDTDVINTTYTTFDNNTQNVVAYIGRNIALQIFDYLIVDKNIMNYIVSKLDLAYGFYYKAVKQLPIPYKTLLGKGTISVVNSTCGAGCGYLGQTGIELLSPHWDILYNGVKTNNQFDQVLFYELGRNFWVNPIQKIECTPGGTVTTGFAVFMRFMAMEYANVEGAPYNGNSFTSFKNEVKGLLATYINNISYNWTNTVYAGVAPTNTMGLGGTDMWASFMFDLYSRYGDAFLYGVWSAIPTINITTGTAIENACDTFALAASKACNANLYDLFKSYYRWPVSNSLAALTSIYP